MRTASMMVALALTGLAPGAYAQGTPKAGRAVPAPAVAAGAAAPATSRADDEKAIAALVQAYKQAFDAGDAQAAAATFAEDALVVDETNARTEGRDAIRRQLAEAFAAAPGSTIVIRTQALRFLGPDTALEEGRTTITPAGGGEPEHTRFTVVYIKHDGRWLQSAIRDEITQDLTPHDRLKALEWMLGDWINESQDAVVQTSCKWTEDGNYLLRDFTMKTRGEPVLSGTQRIGWDPVRHQIRTWIFDSEGGFGEGYWTRDGAKWVIKVEGFRPDGDHVSATNILTRLSKDRASWQSVDRTLGGEALPGIDEFTIVRKPPEVGK